MTLEEMEDKTARLPLLSSSPHELSNTIIEAFQELKAFHRVIKILNMATTLMETKTELNEFTRDMDVAKSQLRQISEALEQVSPTLSELSRKIDGLIKKISLEFEERRKLRAKQLAIIDKLNQYLKNWL